MRVLLRLQHEHPGYSRFDEAVLHWWVLKEFEIDFLPEIFFTLHVNFDSNSCDVLDPQTEENLFLEQTETKMSRWFVPNAKL